MQSWQKIEAWLAANARDLHDALQTPASGEAFRELEQTTQLTLPSDARASYFRHNGQRYDTPAVLGTWWLMSLESALATWKELREAQGTFDAADPAIETAGAVRKRFWNPRWIPVMYDGHGNFICLDLDPAPGGRRGQLVLFLKAKKRREVIAHGMDAWLERYAGDLEKRRWRREASGALVRAAED